MGENVTETPIEPDMLHNIKGAASEGAKLLKIDESNISPQEIIESINKFVMDIQKKENKDIDIWTDLSLPLGCLWGEQMVREFEWEWANIVQHDHDDFKAIGVFAKDRSLAIFPWYFIFGCLKNGAPVKIALAYNMYKDGSGIPELPANGYINLMDHVHHIIPP